jgi:hypothetical protein
MLVALLLVALSVCWWRAVAEGACGSAALVVARNRFHRWLRVQEVGIGRIASSNTPRFTAYRLEYESEQRPFSCCAAVVAWCL